LSGACKTLADRKSVAGKDLETGKSQKMHSLSACQKCTHPDDLLSLRWFVTFLFFFLDG